MSEAIGHEAMRRLAQVVTPVGVAHGFNPTRLVSNWNESEGRTFEQVDAAFGEAIRRVDVEIAGIAESRIPTRVVP